MVFSTYFTVSNSAGLSNVVGYNRVFVIAGCYSTLLDTPLVKISTNYESEQTPRNKPYPISASIFWHNYI